MNRTITLSLSELVEKWKSQEAEGKIDPDLQHWFDIHDYYKCNCGATIAEQKPSKVPICKYCHKSMRLTGREI